MTALRVQDPQQIADYRISALLGEGGQGAVYLGESPGGARVAIKVLHAGLAADPDIRRRFLREAEVAASVAAFCTARVIGTGMAGDRPYIISEYVPGPSLNTLVKAEGPRTGSGLERLAVTTLTALASIHRVGIVHRDFKPSNVILGPEGPVVIDFGIARAVDHLTTTTQLTGTPAYMPPEQLTNQPLTPASDVFSWAGTMVFAATGRMPFPGQTVPAILHAVLSGEPDLSGVPGALRPLLAACLAKDPAARPTVAWLLHDLTGGDGLRAGGDALRAGGDGLRAGGDAAHPQWAQASTGRSGAGPGGPAGHPQWHGGPAGRAGDGPADHTLVDVPAHPAPALVSMPADGRDLQPTAPSAGHPGHPGPRAPRKSRRGVMIAVAAVATALVVTTTALLVPAWLDKRDTGVRDTAVPDTAVRDTGAPDTGALNLTNFDVAVADRFERDTSGQYATFQPEGAEALPTVGAGGGQFTATGSAPYFGLITGNTGLPSTGTAISVLTAGTFAESGEPEDSVFVGWVKDGGSYVTTWYNNTHKRSGINVRVNGDFIDIPGVAPLSLGRGDRLALMLSGDQITSYAETGGTWRILSTAHIGDVLATPQARQQYRYGFGLRASTGTIGITGAEGRSAE